MRALELTPLIADYGKDGTPILGDTISVASEDYGVVVTLFVTKGAFVIVRPIAKAGYLPDLSEVLAFFELKGPLTHENFGVCVNQYLQGLYTDWTDEKESNPNYRNGRRGPQIQARGEDITNEYPRAGSDAPQR